ncbi:MAG TPA: sialidase family protein [Gaiellaceae bacterium]
MSSFSSPHGRRFGLALAATVVAALVASLAASAALGPILTDPFTNPDSQHKTVVEPDTFSAGSTIVAVAQMGQFTDEGASGIGFATTTNNAVSWTSGVLPAITRYQNPAGPYDRATDASIAFDARHNVWIAASLGLRVPGPRGAAVIASRSTNGGLAWAPPVTIAAATGSSQNFEKPWIVCDDTATSPFYGSCYAAFDDHGNGNAFKAAYSRDGGLTWTLSSTPNLGVIGVQPLALPNGKVIVIFDNPSETAIGVITSGNGGVSYGGTVTITSITAAVDPGNIRSSPLPSAEIDGGGKVYVAWQDCRFRTGCTSNDIVYVTSSNGTTWSVVQRVPIDSVTSTVDHLTPGMGADKSSSTVSSHIAVTYYYFPNVSCTIATCQLDVGFISSSNGGTTWSAATQLAGPMSTPWLPCTNTGYMFGDYISTSFGSDGLAHPVIVVAHAPTGPSCSTGIPTYDVALYG